VALKMALPMLARPPLWRFAGSGGSDLFAIDKDSFDLGMLRKRGTRYREKRGFVMRP